MDPNTVRIHGWVAPDYATPIVAFIDHVKLTSTIVTVINTVANTTSTSTKFPPEYRNIVTNHDGTHIQTVSFTRQGQPTVTTV
jgi:hypothetical protein